MSADPLVRADNRDPADLRPLAEAVMRDATSPPVLMLAAWHYLYGWKSAWLPDLAERAHG